MEKEEKGKFNFIAKSLGNNFTKLIFLEDLIMLDMSTLEEIPYNIQKMLSNSRTKTPFEVLNVLVAHVATEAGFVNKNTDTIAYNYSWYYSFDRRIFEDDWIKPSQKMEVKFVMDQSCDFTIECHDMDDLALIVAYKNDQSSKLLSCPSVVLPISRYIPFKKLLNSLPSSFRKLNELSWKLKENVFFPLRNDIYAANQVTSPYLNGMPFMILEKIHKYLKQTDRKNLRLTCKTQRQFRLR